MGVTLIPQRHPGADAFVHEARGLFAALLPDESFDAPRWDLVSLSKTTATKVRRLHFTLRGSEEAPLPVAYAEVVKAWAILGGGSASRWKQRADAARWVWSAIDERLGAGAADLFDWRDFQLADLQRAEQLMIDTGSAPSTVNKTATTMGDLARVVCLRTISPPISFVPSTPRHRDSNNHRVDDPESSGEGILTPAALDALAEVFARAETRQDRVMSAIMALCVATGLRINEVLTLPVNPIQEVEREVVLATGRRVRKRVARIVRHKAKSQRTGGAGRPSREAEWLTDGMAELARMAVSRLLEETAVTRALAKQLEASAGRWVWPGVHRPAWLLQADIVRALGCGPDQANKILAAEGEIDPNSPPLTFPRRRIGIVAFEDYMTARQDWGALTVVQAGPGGKAQRASESLICLRVNELHTGRATLPLITAVTHSMIDRWLKGIPGENDPGVFDRFEELHGLRLREPDGSLVRVNTHQGRRLWVTNLLRAGASVVDVARWQGREHVGDIAAYDNRSMAEKVALVKDGIRTRRLQGSVTRMYFRLAEDVRDVWLEGQVQGMHVTPLGLCIHDFTASPCPKALNCVKNCADYLVDTANPGQRVQLVQLQSRTKEGLARLRSLVESGQIAPSWVQEAEDTLRGTERALSALDAAACEGLVRPFEDAPSRFAPLPAVF